MLSIFSRCKRVGVNSIETVFSAIDNSLISHQTIMLPCEGTNPISLIRNIRFAYRHRSSVNHITGDVHYIALGLGRNTILTIHDVQSALQGRNLFRRIFVRLLWFYLPALIVKKITVISEFTKKELERIIPFAKHKIVVIHNPFSPAIKFSLKNFNKECPVILHIGTKVNKNLERVAEAIQGLNCRLVVLGKMNNFQQEKLEELNISFESYYDLSFEEVSEWYRKCDIVSFPSNYEGFGMPILEANAAGRVILAGDIEVLHEVAGDAAFFVNPYQVMAIREGFVRLIEDRELGYRLVEKGKENVKRFSSEIVAEKYNELYKSVFHKL